MSKRLLEDAYAKELNDWQRIYQLAGMRERAACLDAWRKALKLLGYFEMLRSRTTWSSDPMVELGGRYSIWKRNTNLVMIDMERLWGEQVATAPRCMHAFRDTTDGFELLFAAVPGDEYVISGRLLVTCSRTEGN